MNLRTVAVGWFGLVVLYTVLTRADQASGAIGWASTALDRLASPDKGLIPDRSQTAPPPPGTDWHVGMDPKNNQAHPGTQTPAPVAPGAPTYDFPSWLTPSTGQQQQTPVTGRQ